MKKLLTALFISVFLAVGAFSQEQQIVWEKDFKKAQALALETGRPLLLDFTASWCKPCQMMDKEFWVLGDVVSAMKPFIAVKVDFDNDKSVVNRYGIRAIPFVVFADPLGNMITYRLGFSKKNATELNEIFALMPTDFSSLKYEYAVIEKDKEDGKALLKIADFYRSKSMFTLSNDFYKRAVKSDALKSDAEQVERIASIIAANYYGAEDFKSANKYLGDYLEEYPKGKYREVMTTMLTVANARLFKFKDAEKYLLQLKTEFPSSKNIAFAEDKLNQARLEKNRK
ncbi:MAG: thioredoxin family protein [Pyrinomonadaceae bacterium]|nr:thioredoxin family protein [Pyrinomonadaceae bacterium]